MGDCLHPSRRRRVPVRLVDVPKPERLKAANEAIRHEPDPYVRLQIRMLAVSPPADLIAWIAA